MQLTYADRDLFLDTLHALRDGWRESDTSLLEAAGAWVSQVRPQFGFEETLSRDLVILSRYLAGDGDDTTRDMARGALLYVLQADIRRGDRLAAFGLLDDAFIASYAVHEIQSRLGHESQYSPPRLLPIERKRAEELFLSFFGQQGLPDDDLIAASRKTLDRLGILGASGIFRRLQNNVEYLIRVLSDGSQIEHYDCARAGLNYLICEDDAIGDGLGLVGFLDDNFIVQTAVDLIEPTRDPWLDLLDETTAAWPFLNAVVIGENQNVRRLSEFLLVNAALACPALRKDGEQSQTVIITPRVGPLPFVLGIVRALSVIHEASRESAATPKFSINQKVLVDYETVRIFTGTTIINGKEYFGLKRTGNAGKQGARIDYRPLTDLHRLSPAPSGKITRGNILRDSERIVHALEHLFVGTEALRGLGGRQIVVATDIGKARNLASTLTLHGHPLREVIPMGHLSSSVELTPWSTRFGTQSPLLVCAHDLDHACEYIESAPESTKLVIVDGASRNASRQASVARIAGMGTPVLVVFPMAQSDNVPGIDEASIWEWTDDDLSTLLWPEGKRIDPGPVTAFEQNLRRGVKVAPSVQTISFPEARAAFAAVDALKRAARERGEESLADLDDAVGVGFGLLTRLLRTPIQLAAWPQGIKLLENGLAQLGSTANGCVFVSATEKATLRTAYEALNALFQKLRTNNVKAEAVNELIARNPGFMVVCASRELTQAAEAAGIPAICADRMAAISEFGRGAAIPGWYGRSTMAEALLPPIAEPLVLILYDLETEWLRGFRSWQHRVATGRLKKSDRSRIFPGVQGWRRPADEPPSVAQRDEQTFAGFEAVQEQVWADRRKRLVRESGSDGTERDVRAKLVLFDGGEYAFLGESYRAKVATHLLQATDATGEAELELLLVGQLRVGDALLFRRGADSDVLRVLADAMLPPGTRDRSATWKRALLNPTSAVHTPLGSPQRHQVHRASA